MSTDPQLDAKLDEVREPAIWLRRTTTGTSSSKLGGLPHLPSAASWPRQTRTGLPLHFLAQIDLARLPKTPLAKGRPEHRLPESGMLFFFADIEEEMLWDLDDRGGHEAATRVLYAAAAGTPLAAPADLPEISHPFGEDRGEYSAGIRVYPEAALEAFVIESFAGAARFFQGDASRQADLRTALSIERATGQPIPVHARRDAAVHALPVAYYQANPNTRGLHIVRHQMLGAATNVQGSAEGARGAGFVPLLQLDTDWGLHRSFMFCDMGMAQFWIRPEDLRDRSFDRAWATTEGG
jgi:hypothetical protein